MNPMMANYSGYQAYQKNKYETASPHRLIIMLYDGAIRFAKQTIHCIETNDLQGKNVNIQKFQDIIHELMGSLNFSEGKQIAENLFSIYDYILTLSTKAHLHKDIVPLQESIQLLTELREAWVAISKDVQING